MVFQSGFDQIPIKNDKLVWTVDLHIFENLVFFRIPTAPDQSAFQMPFFFHSAVANAVVNNLERNKQISQFCSVCKNVFEDLEALKLHLKNHPLEEDIEKKAKEKQSEKVPRTINTSYEHRWKTKLLKL